MAGTHLREVIVYDTQPRSSRMSMKRKNSSLVSIDSACALMPVRIEKSDWERVSLVAVGTGRGRVSNEMSEDAKIDGRADVLLTGKAARDASLESLDLVKNECRPLAGEIVGGVVATAMLGAGAVTVCQVTISKIK